MFILQKKMFRILKCNVTYQKYNHDPLSGRVLSLGTSTLELMNS